MSLSEHPHVTHRPLSGHSYRAYGISLVLLGAASVVLVLIALDVALIGTSQQPQPAQARSAVVSVPVSAPVLPVVELSVSPGIKPGPDGDLHDAFSVTDFHVHVRHPVKLVINNTDSMDHSITSPNAGVNIVARPGKHTYTLLVTKPGRFPWFCTFPCDPWSMQHIGYMRGYITAT